MLVANLHHTVVFSRLLERQSEEIEELQAARHLTEQQRCWSPLEFKDNQDICLIFTQTDKIIFHSVRLSGINQLPSAVSLFYFSSCSRFVQLQGGFSQSICFPVLLCCASTHKSQPCQSICALWSSVVFSTFCTHSLQTNDLKSTLRKVDSATVQQHSGHFQWHEVQWGTHLQQVHTVHQTEEEKPALKEGYCIKMKNSTETSTQAE